ncbi:MAG: vWA domain-containing protein [Planctomycetota bacterium]
MNRLFSLVIATGVCVAVLTGCGGDDPVPPGGETVQTNTTGAVASTANVDSYNPDGATIVFVVDTSGSMTKSDKSLLSIETPQLAVATASDADNIGVIAFNVYADVVSKLRVVASDDQRTVMREQLSSMARVRGGTSDFLEALKQAREMLDAVRAPRNSAVIFLTDGYPDEGVELDALREVDVFMHRGWRICAIEMAPRSETQILEQMTSRTGGMFYRAVTPDDMLAAYIEIAQSLQNYWHYEGATPERVPVSSGTKRLMYVSVKRKMADSIDTLEVNGVNVKTTRTDPMFRFPEKPKQASAFDVLSLSNPVPGSYSPIVTGDAKINRILIEPAYKLQFQDNLPPDELYQYDPLQVGVIVSAPDVETLNMIAETGTIAVEVRRDKTGSLLLDPFKLTVGAVDRDTLTLVFSGERRLTIPNITTEEVFNLVIDARVKAGDGGEWVHRFNKKIIYRPTERQRVFALTPAVREFSPVWTDTPSMTAEFTLSRVRGNQAFYELKTQQADLATFSPSNGDLGLQSSADIVVTVDSAGLTPGEVRIRFTVTGATPEGDAPEETGRIYIPAYRFNAPESIDVFALQETPEPTPGQKTYRPLDVIRTRAFAIGATPDIPFALQIEPNPDAKDAVAILGLKTEKTDAGFVLTGDVPPTVQSGDYSGHIIMKPVIAGLKERRIPYVLMIEVPKADLNLAESDQLRFVPSETDPTIVNKALFMVSNEPGAWVETTIDFQPTFVYGAEFQYELGPITSASGETVLDATGPAATTSIRVRGLADGERWDLSELREGARYQLTYRAYVTHDLTAGDYSGQLKLKMVRNGEVVSEESIRVLLSVVRK